MPIIAYVHLMQLKLMLRGHVRAIVGYVIAPMQQVGCRLPLPGEIPTYLGPHQATFMTSRRIVYSSTLYPPGFLWLSVDLIVYAAFRHVLSV